MTDEERRAKAAERSRKYYAENRDKKVEYARQYRARHPDRVTASYRKAVYNISQEQFDTMLDAQDNACAVCSSKEPGGKGAFHVDHCHSTQRIRGYCATTVM